MGTGADVEATKPLLAEPGPLMPRNTASSTPADAPGTSAPHALLEDPPRGAHRASGSSEPGDQEQDIAGSFFLCCCHRIPGLSRLRQLLHLRHAPPHDRVPGDHDEALEISTELKEKRDRIVASTSRWLGLVTGMWMLSCAGSSATYAIYSPALKRVGGYNQQQVDSLAVAKDMGESVGLLPGLLCDSMPVWGLLLTGVGHYLVGFLGLWAVAAYYIPPFSFPVMWGLMLVASQGTAWFNTAVLVTSVRNFPRSRGAVVGLNKGLVGLSGAIFAQAYTALLAPDQADYLALIALLPSLVAIPAMVFLRPVQHHHHGSAHHSHHLLSPEEMEEQEKEEKQNLHFILTVCLALSMYLLLGMLLQDAVDDLPQMVDIGILVGMLTFLLLPLFVPLRHALHAISSPSFRRAHDASLAASSPGRGVYAVSLNDPQRAEGPGTLVAAQDIRVASEPRHQVLAASVEERTLLADMGMDEDSDGGGEDLEASNGGLTPRPGLYRSDSYDSLFSDISYVNSVVDLQGMASQTQQATPEGPQLNEGVFVGVQKEEGWLDIRQLGARGRLFPGVRRSGRSPGMGPDASSPAGGKPGSRLVGGGPARVTEERPRGGSGLISPPHGASKSLARGGATPGTKARDAREGTSVSRGLFEPLLATASNGTTSGAAPPIKTEGDTATPGDVPVVAPSSRPRGVFQSLEPEEPSQLGGQSAPDLEQFARQDSGAMQSQQQNAEMAEGLPRHSWPRHGGLVRQGSKNSGIRRREANLLLAVGEGAVKVKHRRKGPRRGEDFTLGQAVVKADFWLLFFSFAIGCGTGLAAINNLAQMCLAQGYENVRMFVSLISVCNFVGRLLAGYVSEHVVKDYAMPRPVLLLGAQLLMAVGHSMFAWAFPMGSLALGSMMVGLSYGVHWSIMPATASELFGLKHFGMLYNTLTAGAPAGSFVFSGLIAGYLYDREAERRGANLQAFPGFSSLGPSSGFNASAALACFETSSHFSPYGADGGHGWGQGWNDPPAAKECFGAHCFRLTFIIMAISCGFAMVLSFVLFQRTRIVYATLYTNALKKQLENNQRKQGPESEPLSPAPPPAGAPLK